MDEQDMRQMPPYWQKPTDVESLCEEIRVAVDKYKRLTGLNVEWIGLEYGDDISVNLLFEQFEYNKKSGYEPLNETGDQPPTLDP